MAIEEKVCECGCGKSFYGTLRRRFATNYCRVKWNREKSNAQKSC